MGDGSYSHNQHGFEVAGSASTQSAYSYQSLTAVTQIYVGGVRSADSHGTQFTDQSSRNAMTLSGSGIDDRVVVNNQPVYNSNGQVIGTNNATTFYDHSVSEMVLRDTQNQQRTDYVYDTAAGTMRPDTRTVVATQQIDNLLDRTHDVRTDRQTETTDTINVSAMWSTFYGALSKSESESTSRTRWRLQRAQTSQLTTTSVTSLSGPNSGQTTVVQSGTAPTSSQLYETLSSSDTTSTQAIRHDQYIYDSHHTFKGTLTTTDSSSTVQALDGSSSTTYSGSRQMSGPGDRFSYQYEMWEETESGLYEMGVSEIYGEEPAAYFNVISYNPSEPESGSGDSPPSPYRNPSTVPSLPTAPTAGGGFGMPDLSGAISDATMMAYEVASYLYSSVFSSSESINAAQQSLETPGSPSNPESPEGASQESSATAADAALLFAASIPTNLSVAPSPNISAVNTEAVAATLVHIPRLQQEPEADSEPEGFFSRWFAKGKPSPAAIAHQQKLAQNAANQQRSGYLALSREAGLIDQERVEHIGNAVRTVDSGMKAGVSIAAEVVTPIAIAQAGMEFATGKDLEGQPASRAEAAADLIPLPVRVIKHGFGFFFQMFKKGDDVAEVAIKGPNRGLVNAADEVFEQALRNGPESIAGFRIYGNKGLVGDSYARNIFLIEAEAKGANALRGLTNALEAEARAAGAKELRIIGHAVINDGFLNPRIAERLGFTFRRINDGTIELLKVFK